MAASLQGKTIALGVTGSIAAYKSAIVARLLVKAGAKVIPVMTASAERFVGALSLSGITGESPKRDMFDPSFPGEMHVALGARADLVAIVPATADLLARMAQGRADDLLSALVLCSIGPVVAAPAMHPRMWNHPATKRNVLELAKQGRVTLVGPVHGEVASGEVGIGRMAEPLAIVEAIARELASGDFLGLRVVVTAGPTFEDLDPVRFLGNRSSGKMGFAVAERAARRGASVTLVAGPVALSTPPGVERVDVRGAADMQRALGKALGPALGRADVVVMAAAVADYRPSKASATKIKKEGERSSLDLSRNPDLLAGLGQKRRGTRPVLVGFALETADDKALVELARAKLATKRCDFIIANQARDSLSKEDNRVIVVSKARSEPLGPMSKLALADAILDRARARLRK
jgi:phosphopantothenoylcysteine decarboxylase/phosphopantothenate--cysteine ligase